MTQSSQGEKRKIDKGGMRMVEGEKKHALHVEGGMCVVEGRNRPNSKFLLKHLTKPKF